MADEDFLMATVLPVYWVLDCLLVQLLIMDQQWLGNVKCFQSQSLILIRTDCEVLPAVQLCLPAGAVLLPGLALLDPTHQPLLLPPAMDGQKLPDHNPLLYFAA